MTESKPAVKDPIVELIVDKATAIPRRTRWRDVSFCSDHCRQKFLSTAAGDKPGGYGPLTSGSRTTKDSRTLPA